MKEEASGHAARRSSHSAGTAAAATPHFYPPEVESVRRSRRRREPPQSQQQQRAPRPMEKYETLGVVGEGSYGLVLKCRHRETGTMVAIKRFLETEDDAAVRKMALREIRMLKKLRHENLVSMLEVFRRKRRFYLVFEFMDHTLLEELEERAASAGGGLGEATVRRHAFQIIRGLDFCHANNIVHRDVKPENVLVSRLGVVKLCDFGFARLVASPGETYTDYVATRWYRAPELLVGDTHYGREVDVWAVGCLMAEMMTGNPLFAGDSDIDQLFLITKALGKLAPRHQVLVARNPMFKGMRGGSAAAGATLYDQFPAWPRLALDLTAACLRLDPSSRPATPELLQHLYFTADNFPGAFLPELRARIQQECMGNPLLSRRLSNTANSARGRDLQAALQQSELEERILQLPAPNSRHNENVRVSSGPRWKVQLMGPDAVPERRDYFSKPSSRRPQRDEWAEESMPASRGGQSKLSPTRAPSRLQVGLARGGPMQQQQEGEPPPPPSPGEVHFQQAGGLHLNVLHPSINNLSFSTGHPASRLGDPLKRSPLGPQGQIPVPTSTRLKERNIAAPPPLMMAAARSHARRLVERGAGLQQPPTPGAETSTPERPLAPDTPPPHPPLAWASTAGRRLAPMRHRGTLVSGAAPDDFSLPNLPGALGSPTKGLKKRERLPSNLISMDTFPSPDKPPGNKRDPSALERELS